MALVVRGGEVLVPTGVVRADIVVDGGRITYVGPATPAPGDDVIDATGCTVIPGLIDLQCNGAHGLDLTGDPGAVWDVGAVLPQYGVTSWLPTVITSPPATTDRAIDVLAAGPPAGWRGATPLGWHFEGPMLNPSRKGAHPPRHLRAPDPSIYAPWTAAAGVRLVTLAPELPGALDAVRALRAAGVVVSAGHTAASAEEIAMAVEVGVAYVTHLFNAMAPFEHRRPGPVGASLADPALVCGLIVDGIHLHPVAVAAAWQALGPHRASLVTDAVAALGMPDGTWSVGETSMRVGPDGVRTDDGTLAGSNLSAIQAVRNLMAFTGCSLAEAVATMTTVPARLLDLPAKGVIAVGADADLVVLSPAIEVHTTLVRGVSTFSLT